MNKAILLGLGLLLSASPNALGQGTASQPVVSNPTLMPSTIEGYTPGVYSRGEKEDKAHEAYKEKLRLKQNPKLAYNSESEQTLAGKEKAHYEAIEQTTKGMEGPRKEEEDIKRQIEAIESQMDSACTKMLSWVTWGYVQGNSNQATLEENHQKEQKALLAVQEKIIGLQQAIRTQEKGLEEVSGSLNEMTEEKEQLKTTTPGFFKKEKQPKTLQAKLGQLTTKDTEKERLRQTKDATKASGVDSGAVGILAERFILKLAALDELYDMLTEKMKKFSARITKDKEILKLMAEDPDFKQGGLTWWDMLKERLVVEGNTSSGLTPEENKRLRTGLAQIKKVLEDEVTQYAKVLSTFKDYAANLPVNINKFRIKKVDFFKKHYMAVKTHLTNREKQSIEDLANASEQLLKTMKNPNDPHIKSDRDHIINLRNQTGSLKRQLYFLEQAINVKPLTEQELQALNQKIRDSIAETTDPKKLKKTGSLDEMLETLVTLTQIVNESGEDILNPVLDAKIKGFFGANLIKDIAKKSAPATIKTFDGRHIKVSGDDTQNSLFFKGIFRV